MSERSLGAVLYVALHIEVGVMAGTRPSPAAPESEMVADIADHQAGLAVGLERRTVPGTEITLVKQTDGEGEGDWVFSPETMRRARRC